MSAVCPQNVLVCSVLAQRPDMQEAAQALDKEGFFLFLAGEGAPAALHRWEAAGIRARLHLGTFSQAAAALRPAIAFSGTARSGECLEVPQRLVVAEEAFAAPLPSRHITDPRGWVDDYLAPRVPRRCFPSS